MILWLTIAALAIGALVLGDYLRANEPDAYAWNDTAHSGYPDGTDVEVFSRDLLELAHTMTRAVNPAREHVTGPIRRLARRVVVRRASEDHSALKFSVDRPQDVERVRAIYAHLTPGRLMLTDTLAAYARLRDQA